MTDVEAYDRLAETNGYLCDEINRQQDEIFNLKKLLDNWLEVDCCACPWVAKGSNYLCKHYDDSLQYCQLMAETEKALKYD